jgi:hypothetical protein
MTLMEATGATKYVWNPYSLAELKGVLGAPGPSGRPVLDEYLLCVASSEGRTCTPPTKSVFEAQEVVPPHRPPATRSARSTSMRRWFQSAAQSGVTFGFSAVGG